MNINSCSVIVTIGNDNDHIKFPVRCRYYSIQNFSASPVYASVYPDIEERMDDDGNIEDTILIAPNGGAAVLKNTDGNDIYFLGSGKIQIIGTDSSELLFKSAGGTGGGPSGIISYNTLSDLPSINGHKLIGNLTGDDLELAGGDIDILSISATLPASAWGNSAPYNQSLSVEGITDKTVALVDVLHSDDNSKWDEEDDEYGLIRDAYTSNGQISITCLEKPTKDINVFIIIFGETKEPTSGGLSYYNQLPFYAELNE